MRAALFALMLAGCTPAIDLGVTGSHEWVCPEGTMVDGHRTSVLSPECLRTDWAGAAVSIAWALWLWSRINATHASALRTEKQIELLRKSLDD